MKRVLIGLLIVLISAPACARPTITKDRARFDEATAVVDAFHEAMKNGDRDAVLALLLDDVRIYEDGEVNRSKQEYATEHLPSDLKFAATTASRRTDRYGGMIGESAYVRTDYAIVGTFEGKPVDSILEETMVVKPSPYGWRIFHIQWSSRKPK